MISESHRILRFLLTGTLNTIFGYVSYTFLILVGMPLMVAVIGSMVMALLFNFLSYGALVFQDISRRNLPRFLMFYVLFGAFNYLSLRLLEEIGIKPIIGQALLLPALAILCYAGLRLFVFRTGMPKKP
ncbi:GtrA family protein [Agrobacterium tumefaciens]|uniref:GtrA family protein n=1 Tax=Agrobacterium tumefaciens TaxID=358 RepID=UPI000674C9AC|nr:GtrA family protein [Agrobacterium tumefaciens]